MGRRQHPTESQPVPLALNDCGRIRDGMPGYGLCSIPASNLLQPESQKNDVFPSQLVPEA